MLVNVSWMVSICWDFSERSSKCRKIRIGRLPPLGHSERRVVLCLKTVGFFVCLWFFFFFNIYWYFFSVPWDASLMCSGDSGLETKAEGAGEHWAALPCCVSQAWRAVAWLCCSDRCCALQSVNCIKSLHSPALPLLLASLAVFMNVTVKPIRGTTCLLICKPACLASVGTQLEAADSVLISRKAVSEDSGLESS